MIQRFCTSLLASALATAAVAQAPAPSSAAADSPAVTAILDRARAAAGGEWGEAVDFFCGNSGRANRADDPEIRPTRVFDNLYALGRTSTVVWALTTPDGILLIDAGYPDQLESVLLPQLRAAGLDAERRPLRARRARPRGPLRRRLVLPATRRSCRAIGRRLGSHREPRPASRRRSRPAARDRLTAAAPRRRGDGRRTDLVRRHRDYARADSWPHAGRARLRVPRRGRWTQPHRCAFRWVDPARQPDSRRRVCASTCNRSSDSAP